MRKLPAALLACAFPAFAETPFSTDVTDLWWNPDESGWGVNLIQQRDIVFATLFVYDGSSNAHWYVASDLAATASSASSATFQGDLYETSGPSFGANFGPSPVARNKVGTATLQVAFPSDGVLTYTVNGTTVTKAIKRQTWAINDSTGTYEGAREITSASSTVGCNVGASPFSGIRVTQSQSAFNMTGTLGGSACRFDGNYLQEGHLGSSTGTYSCDNGLQGPYTLAEIEVTLYGFSARYSATERGCTVQGRVGGVRANIVRPRAG